MNSNLDLLRAVAVMCVFFAHLHDNVTKAHTDTSWHFGQLGVLMFFVHTSLVLMQSLDRSGATGSDLFKRFYIQRAFRIYPLAIVCVLISYAFGAWTLLEFASNLTLTMNLTHSQVMVGGLWTLPLEVQMYIALPLLFIWFRDKPIYWLLVLWVATIPFAVVQPMITGRLSVVEYIPCFLGGVIAWRMAGRQKLTGWLWPLALAATTIVWMVSPREANMYFRWAFCLTLGLTIPWFREMQWEWVNATAKTIAKYSYGIYLSHAAAMWIAFHALSQQSALIQWAVFVPLAIITPVLAYHLIEHPMIQFGRALTNRTRARLQPNPS